MNTNYRKCNNYFYERACELFGNMTQQKISDLTGIAQGKISDILGFRNFPGRYENKLPSAETVVRIAKGFNVSTDYLLGLTDIKSTDKATKELCDTLGLSEETIKILSANKTTELAKSYASMIVLEEGTELEKRMADHMIDDYSHAMAFMTSSVFVRLVEELVNAKKRMLMQDMTFSAEKSLIELLSEFYRCCDSSRFTGYTNINDSAKQTNKLPDISYISAKASDGLNMLCDKPIKELLMDSYITNITAKLNDIKLDILLKDE